jgi:hypothetical protein
MNEDLVILSLNEIWGCEIPFGWIPIYGQKDIPDTEIYQADYFEINIPSPENIIADTYNLTEIYEITEGGRVALTNIYDCRFGYDGLEYLYTDKDFRFVLYFSHESSVTVGGKALINTIHNVWHNYKNHIWTNI